MDLLSSKTIKQILKEYDAAPLKRLGQNFLINRGVLQKIVEAANLGREDIVLEIGPGLGQMTQELARRAKKVIAIEKDRKFVEILKETMKEYDNVEIIQGDILKIGLADTGLTVTKPVSFRGNGYVTTERDRNGPRNRNRLTPYKVIANLPYYITSPVIRKFLEEKNQPKEMLLMVQKEVAQRICASPPNMSLLSISVQFYAQPKIISYVSKDSFWPSPKVDSAILRLTPKATPIPGLHPDDADKNIRTGASGLSRKSSRGKAERSDFRGSRLSAEIKPFAWAKITGSRNCCCSPTGSQTISGPEPEGRRRAFRVLFFAVVKAGFSAPRKQLAGNFSKKLKIDRSIIEKEMTKAGIEPERRAETLSMEEWKRLALRFN